MKNSDHPLLWLSIPPVVVGEWHDTMIDYAYDTAADSPNYRYYIAAGTDHTILMSPKFFIEASAERVRLVEWVRAMINNRFGTHFPRLESKWKNLEWFDRKIVTPPCLFEFTAHGLVGHPLISGKNSRRRIYTQGNRIWK